MVYIVWKWQRRRLQRRQWWWADSSGWIVWSLLIDRELQYITVHHFVAEFEWKMMENIMVFVWRIEFLEIFRSMCLCYQIKRKNISKVSKIYNIIQKQKKKSISWRWSKIVSMVNDERLPQIQFLHLNAKSENKISGISHLKWFRRMIYSYTNLY